MPTGQWVSYNPNRGDKMPDVYKTEVRIAYDDRNIYFAFHCFDNEPDKIRTNVAKRDTAFSDDWIAISLDSAGTGQTAYHLFSNPSAQPDGRAQHVGVRRAVRRRHGLVQRREDHERRLRRRSADPAADAALLRRRRSADGPRLLPQGQPHRRLVRVAGDAAGPVGVRSAGAI